MSPEVAERYSKGCIYTIVAPGTVKDRCCWGALEIDEKNGRVKEELCGSVGIIR
jgi:hypothetical protein